jgi:hypothetical protein
MFRAFIIGDDLAHMFRVSAQKAIGRHAECSICFGCILAMSIVMESVRSYGVFYVCVNILVEGTF